MTYRDLPVEAKAPDGPFDPRSSLIPAKPRDWKFLSKWPMTNFWRPGSESRAGSGS